MSNQLVNSIIHINDLLLNFSNILENLSITNYEILKFAFGDSEKEYIDLIENIKETNESDIILSYGNNNYVVKIFLENYLEKEYIGKYISLSFNGFVNTTEEYVLRKICQKLNIEYEKAGFENYQKAIENYFKKSNNKDLIIIFYENIEFLIKKKKQNLLYTLLEIINASKNLLFIGFTSHYNLTDLMEKRNRSRFSQKTIYPNIKSPDKIYSTIEQIFINFPFLNINSKVYYNTMNSMKTFSNLIFEREDFVILLYKYYINGDSIIEILLKVKYIITMIDISLTDYMNHKNSEGDEILISELIEILNKILKDIKLNEERGSYYNLLKHFPKLHIIFLICLCYCTSDYKENITIGMIYSKYYSLLRRSNTKKSKLDLVLAKKYLEELCNSNLIYIKNDDKFGCVYQLKLPVKETIKLILKLDEENKIDYVIRNLCFSLK